MIAACGRRPWSKVAGYGKLYSEGKHEGYSESRIGQGNKLRKSRRDRNSKFLWPRSKPRRGRIVNGDTADYGEWPWQVSLRQWRTGSDKFWTKILDNFEQMFFFLFSSNLPSQMWLCITERKLGYNGSSLRWKVSFVLYFMAWEFFWK